MLISICLVCLPLKHLHINSDFGYRIHPLTGKYAMHQGVDFKARSDTVYAILDGYVKSIGYNNALGINIWLKHGQFESVYGHLSQILVTAQDSVKAGEPIGITGATGRVTGEHLHFSICYRHKYINPIKFLYELLKNKKMSKTFKALPIQLSDKLIAEIKEGNSLFQQPVKENGLPAFVKPINPTTGKGYSAMNALILGMQRHDDPRWMSADAARYAGNWVKKDEKGTMIEFSKTSDIQAIRTAEGNVIKDEAGVTQTKTVEFDKPQRSQAFLFNGSQLKDMLPLEEFLVKQNEGQTLSPNERAAKLIEDSKAVIIHGGQEAYYDKQRDAIFMPEPEQFENETKYYQAAIHQLAHWSGHEDRLNRPMEGKFASLDYAREELRAAIAGILIGGELKIGHNFGQHAAYMSNFAKILKDEPFEIAKASRDAQKIANLLLGVSQKREQNQAPEAVGFKKGDEIPYMDTKYKVLETYKTKSIKVEDAAGTRKVLKPEYGLYKSLLEAKTNPREPEMVLEEDQGQSQEQGQSVIQEHKQKIGR